MVTRATILAAAVLLGGQAVAHAAAAGTQSQMATITFRLRVQATPPAHMTFWVAYGPPAPRFGVVRLRRTAAGDFVGTRALPAGVRASFTYLAAWGSVKTRAGMMPGGKVTVIKRTRQVQVGTAAVPMAVWSGPAG